MQHRRRVWLGLGEASPPLQRELTPHPLCIHCPTSRSARRGGSAPAALSVGGCGRSEFGSAGGSGRTCALKAGSRTMNRCFRLGLWPGSLWLLSRPALADLGQTCSGQQDRFPRPNPSRRPQFTVQIQALSPHVRPEFRSTRAPAFEPLALRLHKTPFTDQTSQTIPTLAGTRSIPGTSIRQPSVSPEQSVGGVQKRGTLRHPCCLFLWRAPLLFRTRGLCSGVHASTSPGYLGFSGGSSADHLRWSGGWHTPLGLWRLEADAATSTV